MSEFVSLQDMICSAVADAHRRSQRVLTAPSYLSDDDWTAISKLMRQQGGSERDERLAYMAMHGAAAKMHLRNAVLECERLYEVIRLLSERAGIKPAA